MKTSIRPAYTLIVISIREAYMVEAGIMNVFAMPETLRGLKSFLCLMPWQWRFMMRFLSDDWCSF